MVCQLTLGVGLACPGFNVFVQSAMVRRCVMSGMLCLSVRCCSTSGKSTHGCSQGLVRLCSSSCGSLTLWVWCIMSGTVCWCYWLTVRVVIGHLISPDVAGTDARVIHSFILSLGTLMFNAQNETGVSNSPNFLNRTPNVDNQTTDVTSSFGVLSHSPLRARQQLGNVHRFGCVPPCIDF